MNATKSRKISKILIANRGEIAVRIIRTCREMGIATVAVYSSADRVAPHVLMADEAYEIGPPPAAESYLQMDRIIEVAKTAGADAIHPGYGFLAENPTFARKVMEAGLIFIGPLPETIEAMGSKTESRRIMTEAGVPVVPGTWQALEDLAQARQVVAEIGGYPVMLKAAAGGGGKGMRIVRSDEELERALEAARNEARKAFGDDTVYLEKYVENPKHIEIQVIADQHGTVLHLWERDCSIQRRHQKVVEESPSAVLTPEVRQKMGETAVQAARACNYIGAGTVEFLVDDQLNFYFLEMNTRLQVEHPVTEMVLGLDLVRLQIEIAEGKPLPLKQQDVQARGHAIECRIYAEDPFANFAPSTGKLTYLQPPEGPWVRVDSGVAAHSEISMYYDPMIAKLIVWGEDRPAAIRRMARALREYQISGVETTIPFCLQVVQHPEFQRGTYTTAFVGQHWDGMSREVEPTDEHKAIAAVLRYLALRSEKQMVQPAGDGKATTADSLWKIIGRKTTLRSR
ncbi:MAG TPA: acetyl-CoA carboxylase biotin carboxylase subunit [Calditrichae bacterium]|nr:acetyl-CoA carboxylase biotin carboxylase subunit [Calditrichia bacterium]